MKKVIAFGTFDGFHAGHEAYLSQAKALGDYLVVVIARDETVQKVKGNAPQCKEKQRLAAVAKSGIADKVVLGFPGDKYKIIRKIRPDIIALGYDQFVFTFRLEKFLIDEKIDARVIRMDPFEPSIYKSSLLKTKARHNGAPARGEIVAVPTLF